ncbi:helix-turn-helix domain-containing protein [Actinoplanes teichomyceticus]|uniref:Helix-turn-helix protein n=1 Tax=Actinoplanes teichomyceticus TaxID=1867 RepID=A0A561WPG6_ACTTI|nr:helix-turn-helix transcriptional regulator [Actinoplanes teichomyceticus]TWG25762.1 helix-turn-helix protein [Actinoplanes teichomyceticus]GIF10838.1 hypothetical protein Ate01nite_08700 [Actinoplanes teichomyceticus]
MQPTIGETIAQIRRARPLTQEQLAERADISVETIRELEQGTSGGQPRMSTLNTIARALGVPTSRLLGNAAHPGWHASWLAANYARGVGTTRRVRRLAARLVPARRR